MVDRLKEALQIDIGQTTPDRMFTLEVARCFGACGLAPIFTVNENVHPHVKPEKVGEILALYRNTASESGKGG